MRYFTKQLLQNGITAKPHKSKAMYECNKIKQYLNMFCLATLPVANETDLTQNALVLKKNKLRYGSRTSVQVI